MKTVCICGGGGQCHAIAPYLALKGYTVNILTGHPDDWQKDFAVTLPGGERRTTTLGSVSGNAADVIPQADVVIVTVPGFANKAELNRIKPFLKAGALVGGIFASNGFFFDAFEVLGTEYPLWGLQRVPFICRAVDRGKCGAILGYKTSLHMAVENLPDSRKEDFRQWVQSAFDLPTSLLTNHFEASLTNSNPLLHTARVYDLFSDGSLSTVYPRVPYFYSEWTHRAAELYIAMDSELHRIIGKLPVRQDYLPTVLEYYESTDADSLTRKLCSIEAFKTLLSPMKVAEGGYVADVDSRYFLEDFNCSLSRYVELATKLGVEVPSMRRVLDWGLNIRNVEVANG